MKKYFNTKIFLFSFLICLIGIAFFIGSNFKSSQHNMTKTDFASTDDFYTNKIQKIFNNRCIACHGCYEAPCQLSLQSYDGLLRGVHKDLVYDDRITAATPTRFDFDANNIEQWRTLGFNEVIGNKQSSVLLNSVQQGPLRTAISNTYPAQRQCLNQNTPNLVAQMKNKNLAMPYNLPPLDQDSIQDIKTWIENGAIPPEKPSLVETDSDYKRKIQDWNDFLNINDFKHRLTSRYLYEHLYLAHLYFSEKPRNYYRLIRSSTPCDNPNMISTRLANDHPGMSEFYYCVVKYSNAIVSKSHLPYEIGEKKLDRIKHLFINTTWPNENGELPSYDKEIASNPFLTFKDIPQESRYRFLIEDAHYNVMTFIKGPVCNGSGALNSIQDRFFVFFMNPEMDSKINTQESLIKHILPGRFISTSNNLKTAELIKTTGDAYVQLIKTRKNARNYLNKLLQKEVKDGLSLDAIWNGDGHDSNAVLTIMRHDNNAAVFKGAIGDLPKTAFVLDYSTLERLVYNLVVNFDVFGNLGHQLLSRIYMDIIRMDAEDAYLNFLPPSARLKLKSEWYSDKVSTQTFGDISQNLFSGWISSPAAHQIGALTARGANIINSAIPTVTQFQQKYLYEEENFPNIPNSIKFMATKGSHANSHQDLHLELIHKILFDHLGANILKNEDTLNWYRLKFNSSANKIEEKLSRLTKHMPQPYARFFPELSFLILGNKNASQQKDPQLFYSIAHNRELNSIAWVFAEKLRELPEDDSLTISSTVLGSHPNQFFYVDFTELEDFVNAITKINTKDEYMKFFKKYGVTRMDPDIWKLYDFANANYLKNEPIDAGYLDLFRYNY